MDIFKYFKTPLEQSIEDFYINAGLLQPEDLTVENIATAFNVDVILSSSHVFSDNELGVIFLNSNLFKEDLKKSFIHELAHVVRHVGDQRRMPELFKQMQEADAESFALYACMPFFMLERLTLPPLERVAAGEISKLFGIPPKLALRRLRQVSARITEAEILTSFTYNRPTHVSSPTNIMNSTSLPSVKGIYGLEDFSTPHTLVIQQKTGFDWQSNLHIPVEGVIRSIEDHFYSFRDAAIVQSGDLSISGNHVSNVVIDMKRVFFRYGRQTDKLLLPMEAVEEALNF